MKLFNELVMIIKRISKIKKVKSMICFMDSKWWIEITHLSEVKLVVFLI